MNANKAELKILGGSIAKIVTAMGYTRENKPMNHRQGLEVVAKAGGLSCWRAVAALKQTTELLKIWTVTWYDRKYGDFEFSEVFTSQIDAMLSAVNGVEPWGDSEVACECTITEGVLQYFEITTEDGGQTYVKIELTGISTCNPDDGKKRALAAKIESLLLLGGDKPSDIAMLAKNYINDEDDAEIPDSSI